MEILDKIVKGDVIFGFTPDHTITAYNTARTSLLVLVERNGGNEKGRWGDKIRGEKEGNMTFLVILYCSPVWKRSETVTAAAIIEIRRSVLACF